MGRTIIPGRIQVVETQTPVGIGGAQVRPGDMVGCDDEGIVLVPSDVAQGGPVHAKSALTADMKSRLKRYASLNLPMDETVGWERIEACYASLE